MHELKFKIKQLILPICRVGALWFCQYVIKHDLNKSRRSVDRFRNLAETLLSLPEHDCSCNWDHGSLDQVVELSFFVAYKTLGLFGNSYCNLEKFDKNFFTRFFTFNRSRNMVRLEEMKIKMKNFSFRYMF